MQKYETKLYNVIFPIWLLIILPVTWIVVLPVNFIIDLLVVTLTLKFMKIQNIKSTIKAVILKVWIFGFISDWWYEHIVKAVAYDPFSSIYAVLWITVCIFITGILIYFFNYKISFKKASLTILEKKRLALSVAIFTAPYLFYLPTKWFYRGP